MRCPEARDALLEITTGRTPPDLRRAVAVHLAGCPRCRALASELEETTARLRAVPTPLPPEGFWPDFMRRLEERLRRRERAVDRLRRALRPILLPAAGLAATVALVVSSPYLRPPPPTPSAAEQIAPYVTETIRSQLPHLEEALGLWQSGLEVQEAGWQPDPLEPR